MQGIVKDVQPNKIILDNGEEVPYGLLVWSTGVGASPFVKSLPFPKSPGGRYNSFVSVSIRYRVSYACLCLCTHIYTSNCMSMCHRILTGMQVR